MATMTMQQHSLKSNGFQSKESSKIMPAWEHKIRLHTYNLKHCVNTGNFEYVHATKALDLHTQQGMVDATAGPIPGEIEIKESQTAVAEDAEVTMSEFRANVEKLKTTQPVQEEWELLIMEQSAIAKQRSNDAIDSAEKYAISMIKELPAGSRAGAAGLYVTASNFVGDLMELLGNQLKAVFDQVVNFLKNIWAGLKNAYDAVVKGVNTVVGWIKGIFGSFEDFASDFVVGGPEIYIGRLNWPAVVGVIAVTAALVYVTTQLANRGITYTQQTTILDDNEGGQTIRTETHIGLKDPATKRFRGIDLAAAWKECVADLGNDGHWIPEESS